MNDLADSADRRFADRRRAALPRSTDESWFGGPAIGGIAGLSTVQGLVGDPSADAAAALADESAGGAADAVATTASAGGRAVPSTFERIYRAFIAARAALGLALVVALVLSGVFGSRPPLAVSFVSLLYAALAISLWLMPQARLPAVPRSLARLRSPQWVATIGADLVCFLALHIVAPGSSLNYVALLVLPVLMAGVLTPRVLALATAAAISIVLLLTAWASVLEGAEGTAQMTQAGLAGTGFFAITVLANELAGRLAREELTARGSLEMARQQAQLNRLVIEEMQDGVLVVDRDGRVRTANPAALSLLAPQGTGRPAPFQLRGVPAWDALVRTVERAFREASWPEAGRDVSLNFGAGAVRVLRARVRFTRKRDPDASEDLCVLFLEDVRNMQARSRQEKLAAMGRVSAGIAHEIRNPLAAIAQANALLAEDATDPAQRRLMQMVTENVARLKRIVEDVMEVAHSASEDVGLVDATALVAAVCSEWARANGIAIGDRSVLQVDLPDEALGAAFDPEHLRRVLVNLLDNAVRHASGQPGAVRVKLDSRRADQAFLSVASDGPPIAPDVEPYLFEPFFSTRSRGTGLGLYICRELCERYGATIGYRLRTQGDGQRNEFFVDMRSRALAPVEGRLHSS